MGNWAYRCCGISPWYRAVPVTTCAGGVVMGGTTPAPTQEKYLIRKKLITAAIVAVVASLSLSSVASAKVERCAVPITSTTEATWHVYNPANATGQWNEVWQHDFAITV